MGEEGEGGCGEEEVESTIRKSLATSTLMGNGSENLSIENLSKHILRADLSAQYC